MRRVLIGMAAGVAAMAVGLFLVAWSGAYNIAASRGHWAVIEWFLQFGMHNSVEARAHFVPPPPPLDDPDLYRLGAGHFNGGCAACHGAPGIRASIIARHALPPPPDLNHAAQEWRDSELFWIVKHGIKYTGMPAWPSQARDDEVWALVAFLKKLPSLDAATYRDWAWGGLPLPPRDGRELAIEGHLSEAISACARCHGLDDKRPASNRVPVLHGQPAAFLAAALQDYAKGLRESGIMQPVAADLSVEAINRLADYYSRLRPPQPAPPPAPAAAALARGRALATTGAPEARIPPCAVCHGADAMPAYPRLAGQNAAYMKNRLRLWRSGVAFTTETDAIMAPIARLLDDRQIEDVSLYFAGQR